MKSKTLFFVLLFNFAKSQTNMKNDVKNVEKIVKNKDHVSIQILFVYLHKIRVYNLKS